MQNKTKFQVLLSCPSLVPVSSNEPPGFIASLLLSVLSSPDIHDIQHVLSLTQFKNTLLSSVTLLHFYDYGIVNISIVIVNININMDRHLDTNMDRHVDTDVDISTDRHTNAELC